MAEAWVVQRDANGIRVIDENGLPVCVQCSAEDANTIASAPRLQEQVKTLREALAKAKESLDYAAWYLDKEDSEEVVESVDKGIKIAFDVLEKTKERIE